MLRNRSRAYDMGWLIGVALAVGGGYLAYSALIDWLKGLGL